MLELTTRRTPVKQSHIRIAEILLGLKDVNLIGIEDLGNAEVKLSLRVHIECRGEQPKCPVSNGMSYSKGSSLVEPYDLQRFGCAVRLLGIGTGGTLDTGTVLRRRGVMWTQGSQPQG